MATTPAMAMAVDRPTMPSPAARARRRLATGLYRRRLRRHRPERHQHLLQPVDVDGRLDLRVLEESLSLLVHRDDASDRQTLGKDAVEPGAENQVPDLQVL